MGEGNVCSSSATGCFLRLQQITSCFLNIQSSTIVTAANDTTTTPVIAPPDRWYVLSSDEFDLDRMI